MFRLGMKYTSKIIFQNQIQRIFERILAVPVPIKHEEVEFACGLFKQYPDDLQKVLLSSANSPQGHLLLTQNDPKFIQTILENLGPSLKEIIKISASWKKENIFHKLASKIHLQSCEFLVKTLEDDFVAELMLSRDLIGCSPLVLAISSSEAEVAELFWNACEKGVLNNPPCLMSLREQLKVSSFTVRENQSKKTHLQCEAQIAM